MRSRAAAVRCAMLVAGLAACDGKRAAPVASSHDAGAAVEAAAGPTPLPPATPTAPIGNPGPVALLAADDAGAWQALCEGDRYDTMHLQVVVDGGPGFEARDLIATATHDLIVRTAHGALHVDVTARTTTKLGRIADAAIDDASRRVVLAVGDELVVRDPGKPPRRVAAGGEVTEVSLRTARWAEVWHGAVPKPPESGCNDQRGGYRQPDSTIVDLDPTGAEAVDTVGPQIAITPAGEIKLSGEVVIGAECSGQVVAAMADPPRLLALCSNDQYLLAIPGQPPRKLGTDHNPIEIASISEHVVLGRRVVCFYSGCADLVDGTWYPAYRDDLVVYTEAQVVRRDDFELLVDDVVTKQQTRIPLPKISQEITLDTVTGRRKVGTPPPAAATLIDLAGSYILYGRFVIDLAGAKVTQTLAEDALAVDRTGRALVPAAAGLGPLRWVGP